MRGCGRGRALEGNLEGDSPDGYTATAAAHVKSLAITDSIDRAVAAGAREMMVVIPDAFNKYSRSMFSNSPTTGDWEAFIARDLTT